jgi:hypothetical protein
MGDKTTGEDDSEREEKYLVVGAIVLVGAIVVAAYFSASFALSVETFRVPSGRQARLSTVVAAVTDAVIVVLTLFYVIFSARQWRLTRQQLRMTRQSNALMQRA